MVSNFKFLIYLFFVFCLFVMPASAFTDDFEDQDILDWNVISGVWVAGNGTGINGINDFYLYNNQGVGATSEIEIETTGIEDNYIEFNFKSSGSSGLGGASTATTHISLFSDGTTNHGFTIAATSTVQTIDVAGWAYNPYSFSADTWYKIAITRTPTNIKVDIYDVSDNLLDTQTSAYTLLSNADRINIDNAALVGGSISIFIDNIFTSNVAPSAVNGIDWDEDQYIEGDTASYTWTLENDAWTNLISKYRVQVLCDGLEIESNKVSQTGTRFIDVDTAGTHEIKLQYSGLFLTNWQFIDNDIVHVIPEVDSWISVPQSITQKTEFTLEYMYGGIVNFLPAVFIYHLDDYSNSYEFFKMEYLPASSTGVVGSYNTSLFSSGVYKLALYDANLPEEQWEHDVITVNKLYIPPTISITTSNISATLDTYSLGSSIYFKYQVDYTNFTSYVINYELYNYDTGIMEVSELISSEEQTGKGFIQLSNPDYIVSTGEHSLRLASYFVNNGTFKEVLSYDNVTVNMVDWLGYGLRLSKYEVFEKELFAIIATTPVPTQVTVSNRLTLDHIDNMTINGSAHIPYSFLCFGEYEIRLTTPALDIIQYITVLEFVPDEDGDEEGVVEDSDDIVSNFKIFVYETFGSSPAVLFVVGVFIAALCAVGFAAATKHAAGGVVGAILGIGIAVSIGFISMVWAVLVVIIAGAIVMVVFKGAVG